MKNGWHTNCEGQVLNPQCPRRLLSSGPVHWPSARGQDSWRVQADSVYVSTWTAPAVVTAWLNRCCETTQARTSWRAGAGASPHTAARCTCCQRRPSRGA